ncbi:class I SAM-dependent methyltransferase [Phreatobacter oligotrophus]|uniref:Methyltransferase family protein n=1 Tax=Phreatobacter oligotrophus TaxID=1122261 RepID=A0A2T4YLR6_9HYPH|nr:methyltransferase domain-containing protein [Phreatobacter oligotrophus]PTM44262.1 hypothetical protein C8P69_1344 [Phreatobacter oligotrophus]
MVSNWTSRLVAALRGRVGSAPAPDSKDQKHGLDEYVTTYPGPQNAIDILKGWNQAFPAQYGVSAGSMALYNDPRIHWAIEKAGGVAGKRVLEVGPLEAWHTYMLEQHQPVLLDAVEANKLSFLRCLVVKEIVGLKIARFHLGDAQLWLEQRPERYDVVIASGVLYHMQDPIRFLRAIAARTDSLFLWTHYVDDVAMPPGDPRRGAFISPPEVVLAAGVEVKLYPRTYLGAWQNASFCGGMHDIHRWIEKESLIALLRALGLSEIEVSFDQTDHTYGPACCIFAKRPA